MTTESTISIRSHWGRWLLRTQGVVYSLQSYRPKYLHEGVQNMCVEGVDCDV